ncbi:hypothetical protein CRG98_032122 [Punica granatum]|uniref:Uncharacterized protein n=1 Tax=Punica granatum TaxID=22663 RepID=A0A2I0IU60_PUNGR|nr:hypothetical protein CRG98_032122 [Punica granatum]
MPTSLDGSLTSLSLPNDKEITVQEPFHRAQPPLGPSSSFQVSHQLSRVHTHAGQPMTLQPTSHLPPPSGTTRLPRATEHSHRSGLP